VVPKAEVEIHGRTLVTTDDQGVYDFGQYPVGTYAIKVRKAGFFHPTPPQPLKNFTEHLADPVDLTTAGYTFNAVLQDKTLLHLKVRVKRPNGNPVPVPEIEIHGKALEKGDASGVHDFGGYPAGTYAIKARKAWFYHPVPGRRPFEFSEDQKDITVDEAMIDKNSGELIVDEVIESPFPLYEPAKWNDGGAIQHSTNCYAYAANDRTGHPKGKPQPGEHSKKPFKNLTCSDVTAASVSDGMVVAPDPPTPKSGYYPVALVIDPDPVDGDYHWYRQAEDGTWSHKPGWSTATNLDASGKPITDPKAADRDYSVTGGNNYSTFCGYFYVPADTIKTGP
jgi:hypothetical protein